MARPKLASRRFLISDSAFEMLTEAARILSNRIKKFASVRTVIEHAIAQLEDYEFDEIHFLEFISSETISGEHPLHVSLQTSFNEKLSILQTKLEVICGIEIFDRTAIAYFVQLCIDKKLY